MISYTYEAKICRTTPEFTFFTEIQIFYCVCVLYILLKFHTNYRIYISTETVNDLISIHIQSSCGR